MVGIYQNQPATLEEAVEAILSELTDEDKASIRDTARENLFNKHYWLGLYIGNRLGLWRDNKKLLVSCGMYKICSLGIKDLKDEYPFTDPQESSRIILTAIWERLQEPGANAHNIVSV